jgi:hypothetical protein
LAKASLRAGQSACSSSPVDWLLEQCK